MVNEETVAQAQLLGFLICGWGLCPIWCHRVLHHGSSWLGVDCFFYFGDFVPDDQKNTGTAAQSHENTACRPGRREETDTCRCRNLISHDCGPTQLWAAEAIEQEVEKKQTLVVVATLFHMIVAQPSYELPRPRPVPTCQLHFVTACCPLMSWPDHFCRWGQQLFNFFRVASSSQTVVALKATVFSIRVSARSFSWRVSYKQRTLSSLITVSCG